MGEQIKAAIEALRQAKLNEMKTFDFYMEAVEKATDEKARQMFQELAEEEALHVKIVQEQYESLKTGAGWTSVADFEDLSDVDIRSLEFKRSDMDVHVTDATTDLEALIIAAELENNSFNFYTEQYNRTTDPLGKQIYGGLVKSERNHFNMIISNWEYMVNAGT